jgi:hypothetical protein
LGVSLGEPIAIELDDFRQRAGVAASAAHLREMERPA